MLGALGFSERRAASHLGKHTRQERPPPPACYARPLHAAPRFARPQALHRRPQLFSLPPSTPPRTTCTLASCSRPLSRRYDDDIFVVEDPGSEVGPFS
jgi:hypothetical protein